jgi:hypothetical protein
MEGYCVKTLNYRELKKILETNDRGSKRIMEKIAQSGYIICSVNHTYTGCPRRNVPDFGRVFLMLKYTDITQNTYIHS